MHSDHWVSFLLLFAFLRGTTKVYCVRIMYVYTYIIVYMYTRNEQHKLLKNSMHNYEPMSKLVQTHRQQNPFAEKCFGPSRAADLSRKLLWSYAHSQARLWGSSGGNKSTDPKWLRTQIRKFTGSQIPLSENGEIEMQHNRCETVKHVKNGVIGLKHLEHWNEKYLTASLRTFESSLIMFNHYHLIKTASLVCGESSINVAFWAKTRSRTLNSQILRCLKVVIISKTGCRFWAWQTQIENKRTHVHCMRETWWTSTQLIQCNAPKYDAMHVWLRAMTRCMLACRCIVVQPQCLMCKTSKNAKQNASHCIALLVMFHKYK